jgi:hypothetical protein
MVMTVSWCKGVNLWSFARCLHHGVLTCNCCRIQHDLYPRDEFPCSGFTRQQARARSIEHQRVIVIMGNRQVSCAHRDLQRIDLCAGWHVDTRLSGRGGPNAIAATKLILRI